MSEYSKRPGALYCAALLLEALIFHRHVLFYPGYSFPWDFRGVHVPLAAFVAGSFQRGELPLWDPFTYCGVPIFANIQTALFYPPVLLATALGAWWGTDLLPRLLAISVVAQVVFAGVCTFILLRRLRARPGAAWIAGTMYELGCFFGAQAEHMGAMQGAAWLPFIWLCVVELRGRAIPAWLAGLAAALAMTILAGLPQVAVAAFLSAVCLGVLLALFRMARWRSLVPIVLACGWSLVLAAVQFIPTTELVRNSVARYRSEWLGSGGGIHPGALWSLVIPNYWSVFDPAKFHGPTDLTFLYLYSSILGLALALIAMAWRPERWARVFGVLTLLTSIAMLGDQTWVGRTVLMALPVQVRIGIHPEFFFCVFSLGLAILAGLGADRMIKNPRGQILVGIVIACDLVLVSSGRPMNRTSTQAEPGITHNAVDGSTELVSRLRALTGSAFPLWRFDMTGDVPFGWSSSAPLLELPTANGCDPLAPERIIQARLSFAHGPRWGTCYQVVNPASPVLGLMNARYLLSRASVSEDGLRLAAEIGGYKIYENQHTLPRYFLLNRVQFVSGLAEAAAIVHSPDFDPSAVAVVEADANDFAAVRPAAAPGIVKVLSYAASEVVLETQSATPRLLVAGDAYYPGWEATVDGAATSLYPTDVAFRGIRIPQGQHRIAMRFVPRTLYWSALLSAVAALMTGLYVWRSSYSR